MISKYKIVLSILTVLSCSLHLLHAQRISAGGWHSLAICNDSTVKGFGENATGQLGNGSNTDSNIPVSTSGLISIVSVSGGGDQLEAHSLALKADGTVWAWGSNLYGGLGNGSINNTNTPVQTLLLNDIISIAAGGWHSVALKNDGTVWTWGWNTDGQLGDGSTTDRSIAAVVNGLQGITHIASGTYHVLALKNDGTVWAWGDNVSGQLGNSTTVDALSPIQVQGLSNIVAIAAGRFFSLAIKNDGSVWTWGENLYGQLGNGTTLDSPIPVQVNGVAAAIPAIVACGAFHVALVKNDGTTCSWGRNTYGNLGNGTVNNSSTPVLVQSMSNVASIAAGTNFTLYHKSDGSFWACGRNTSGQLGDGTNLQQNTVVQASTLCPILSVPTSINDVLPTPISASIYPNPSSNRSFYIQTDISEPANATLYVETYSGQRLYESILTTSAKQQTKIDLPKQIHQGMYIVRLTTKDRQYVGKITLQ